MELVYSLIIILIVLAVLFLLYLYFIIFRQILQDEILNYRIWKDQKAKKSKNTSGTLYHR